MTNPPEVRLPRTVFVAGGTGFIGRRLLPVLAARGHRVIGLVRPISRLKLDPSAELVLGSALSGWSYAHHVAPADTFVHLVGVPERTSPDVERFRDVDLAAVEASLETAKAAGVSHFIFVSVAQPAPATWAFAQVRAECEARIRESGLRATILRPLHVYGSGIRRPNSLLPLYSALDLLRAGPASRRWGTVSLEEMLDALVHAVESPPTLLRLIEVDEMKARGRALPAIAAGA